MQCQFWFVLKNCNCIRIIWCLFLIDCFYEICDEILMFLGIVVVIVVVFVLLFVVVYVDLIVVVRYWDVFWLLKLFLLIFDDEYDFCQEDILVIVVDYLILFGGVFFQEEVDVVV